MIDTLLANINIRSLLASILVTLQQLNYQQGTKPDSQTFHVKKPECCFLCNQFQNRILTILIKNMIAQDKI